MKVTVGYGQVNELIADLGKAGQVAGERASKAVRKTALDIARDAKIFAPVDTGNLRNSIGVDTDPDGLGAQIGPTASYAPFVEWGTVQHGPQAFMGPAFDRNATDLVTALEQIAGGAL